MPFASDDTLSSKVSKHVDNGKRIEFAALRVCEESIFGLESERHVTGSRVTVNIIVTLDGATETAYIIRITC